MPRLTVLLVLVVSICAFACLEAKERPLAGGWSDEMPVRSDDDEKFDKIINKVKTDIENELGTSIKSIKVISLRHQMVAGSNYMFKVRITEKGSNKKSIAHIRIHKNLKHQPKLIAAKGDVDEKASLEILDQKD